MADNDLRVFLQQQARSLDSLLALTPAKNLFGEDVSDQWKRKKQTPEEKRAAKKAKLDPSNWKTAKDVYDERSAAAAKKRKREAGGDVDERQGEKDEGESESIVKKQKRLDRASVPTEAIGERPLEEVRNRNAKKRHKKRQSQKQRNAELREQREEAKVERKAKREQERKQAPKPSMKQRSIDKDERPGNGAGKDTTATLKSVKVPPPKQLKSLPLHEQRQNLENEEDEEDEDEVEEDESMPDVPSDAEEEEEPMVPLVRQGVDESDTEDNAEDQDAEDSWEDASNQDGKSTASSSEGISEILSPLHDSASSSVSSIQPPQVQPLQPKQKTSAQVSVQSTPTQSMQSEADREAARERLQQQISQFRSQRKADEKPIRSRADLLEQRRRKEQERKAAKKEQRKKEKEEEARRQDEEMAKRFSPGGSGSLLASPRSPMTDDGSNAFSFGRIAFEDGTQFDPSSGAAAAQKKHKGPADTASALKAAQAKQAKVAGLDEQKKADIGEKDMWLNARKRAHGERVKDDTSLLKKALKRQEKQKSKSEKEWDNRIEGVRSSQEAKQKKRTDNLQKRKDEKHAKKSGSKKVKRPGFEGSFRGRTGKGKKK